MGFCPKFLEAIAHQRVVDTHADAGRGVDFADFLHGQHVADGVHAGSSVVGVDPHSHEAQLAQLAHFFGGETLVSVALDDARFEDVLGEIAGRVADRDLLFCEVEVHCLLPFIEVYKSKCQIGPAIPVKEYFPFQCMAKITGGGLPTVGMCSV